MTYINLLRESQFLEAIKAALVCGKTDCPKYCIETYTYLLLVGRFVTAEKLIFRVRKFPCCIACIKNTLQYLAFNSVSP